MPAHCRQYAAGRCRRGAKCPYLHQQNPQGTQTSSTTSGDQYTTSTTRLTSTADTPTSSKRPATPRIQVADSNPLGRENDALRMRIAELEEELEKARQMQIEAEKAAERRKEAESMAGSVTQAQEIADYRAEIKVRREAEVAALEAASRAQQSSIEAVKNAKLAQENAEKKAKLEAERAEAAVARAKFLADAFNSPSTWSRIDRSDSTINVDAYLQKAFDHAAAKEYACTIQRIVSGSTLATFGPGLDLQSIVCGFDNGLIEVHGIPLEATLPEIEAPFVAISARFCVIDIRQIGSNLLAATVAVREDVKQRAADAINGKTIRHRPLKTKVLKTAMGYASPRHDLRFDFTYDTWSTSQSVLQSLYDELKQRLLSSPGFVSLEYHIGLSGAIAQFNSWTHTKNAYDRYNSHRLTSNSPIIRCTMPQATQTTCALAIPLEQYYFHESGTNVKYNETSVDSKAEGVTVRVKSLGHDWFDGSHWFKDEGTGASFLAGVRRQVPELTASKWDCITKTLFLYAGSEACLRCASTYIETLTGQSKRIKFSERIHPSFTKSLIQSGRLDALKKELGEGEISFNIFRSRPVITYPGGSSFFAVRNLMEDIDLGKLPAEKRGTKANCPVCLSEVSSLESVALICGHKYCISCLKRCILTAPEQNRVPIVCVGEKGECKWRVAIPIIQSLLTPIEFHNLIERVAQQYLNQRSDQYRYCITPDCTQVYRCSKGPKYITCSSCNVSLCSSCHSKAHGHLSCADWAKLNKPMEQDRLAPQLSPDNKSKKCPKCQTLIYKHGDGNDVHCQDCKAHICWVCLVPFKDSFEIYDHMSAMHGGINSKPNNRLDKDVRVAQSLQTKEVAECNLGTDAAKNDSGAGCMIM